MRARRPSAAGSTATVAAVGAATRAARDGANGSDGGSSTRSATTLARLGLHRPELRAWVAYDWANSAIWTAVIASIFPAYFYDVAAAAHGTAAEATARFALATTVGLVTVAVLAPVLGALADFAAVRKRMLLAFLALGAAATASLYFVQRGDWLLALALFVLIEVGVSGSCVFYDALLPHVARPDEIDRVSTTGYALGYLGGGLLLALNFAWIARPGWFGLPAGPGLTESQATLPVRLAFVSAAAWWVAFAVPLFRRVGEPPAVLESHERSDHGPVRGALSRLGAIVRELRRYPDAMKMLVAVLIYSDGVGTLIRMAVIYGAEIGIGKRALVGSILLVQFVSIPFALLFGRLAAAMGPKRAIFLGLGGYAAVSVFAYFMMTGWHFLILSLGVAAVQGGTQALSRSLFASLIPKHKSAEFFGLFAVSERFAGIVGPVIFAAMAALTGSSRSAILSIVVFFAAGAAVLTRVNVPRGRQAAAGLGASPDLSSERRTP
jgi:UMF1 family MFS transporter